MALRPVTLALYENTAVGRLQSQVLPPGAGAAHGSIVNVSSLVTAANPLVESTFLGGAGGKIESLAAGTTIADGSNWSFTEASHNPAVFNDNIRRKVAKNDFFAQADVDAVHAYNFATAPDFDQKILLMRWIRPVVKTTGGVDYSVANTLQYKALRMRDALNINDTNDNSVAAAPYFRWWAGNGNQLRVENGGGLVNGTATGGSANTLVDTSKNLASNILKYRGLQLTDGSSQFSLLTANTATTLTTQFSLSPAPSAGTTYEVQSATIYAASDDIDINAGWQLEQTVIQINSQNVANGKYIRRILKSDGWHEVFNKTDLVFYDGIKKFSHAIFQNYFGNNSAPMVTREIYSDDEFIQVGSTNFLAISTSADNLTPSKFEIQKQNSWSGNAAQITLNTGGISTLGNYFLLEIDALTNSVLSSRVINIGQLGG